MPFIHGEMSEWFKEPVLKTGEAQVSVGSNPTLSAIFMNMQKYPRGRRGSPAKGVGWIKPARGFKSLLPRHVKPCNLNGYRVFVYPLTLILTLYRFQRAFAAIVSTGDFLNKFLHAVSGLLSHFLRYMTIHIQGKAGGGMAQIGLHCLDVIAALNGSHSKAVP